LASTDVVPHVGVPLDQRLVGVHRLPDLAGHPLQVALAQQPMGRNLRRGAIRQADRPQSIQRLPSGGGATVPRS